ncbi:MAG: HDOD domain-containing protein [Burkholderiaceae bacterium]|nr:MAG: HDOD domain-containing protein [Burkholderiaceae bacterium]
MPEGDSSQALGSWLARFSQAEIPVMRQTARRLDDARQRSDRVSSRDISEIVLDDPLLSIRVLAYIQSLGSKRLRSEITNIASAVMMLGVEPFFRTFDRLPTIETLLGRQPQAQLGLLQVVVRSQRAARYAHDWAFARHDLNVEEVALAALLHDLAEILLWCFGPQVALEIRSRLQANRQLRSAAVQEEVLGFPLADLQLALCHAWLLPPLLTTMIDDRHADTPRVQNVKLAVDLARHSVDGWTNPALVDDFAAIERLLRVDRATLLARLQVPVDLLSDALRDGTTGAEK